ncbi:MAG: hypothetical protein LC791_04310 [Acidobacteria bacterium]|nr:hypothetical protein [Acidobacteriota bacterium]
MRGKVWQALFAIATTVILTAPVAAQDMSSADIERLQETVNDIGTDIATLRRRDAAAARTLQSQLDELQEEVIYLKVKQRKERNVPRAAFLDVRDQLENLRGRARGDDGASGAYASTSTAPVGDSRSSSSTSSRSGSSRGTIPVGTELDVRLETALSSNTAQVEDRFEATTEVDLREEGRVLIPAGSRVRGVVSDVKEAGRVERKGSLTLTFDQISVNGRSYPLRATVTVVAATEGEDVRLPAGTVLRIRIDQPLTIR